MDRYHSVNRVTDCGSERYVDDRCTLSRSVSFSRRPVSSLNIPVEPYPRNVGSDSTDGDPPPLNKTTPR